MRGFAFYPGARVVFDSRLDKDNSIKNIEGSVMATGKAQEKREPCWRIHPGGGRAGSDGGGGRKAKSEEDEGDLEVTIISRDGPDKLIVDHGAWSVTFSWTRVTLAVTIQSSQR